MWAQSNYENLYKWKKIRESEKEKDLRIEKRTKQYKWLLEAEKKKQGNRLSPRASKRNAISLTS